jgi:phenylacetate-CoA ligase
MLDWHNIYNIFPYPLKVLAASTRGYYLRWWRYGADTEKLVEEALERETWSSEQWRKWQDERLAFLLHRAATRVPYYKAYWAKLRREGSKASWEILENWPILKKDILKDKPYAFVAEDCNIKKMFCENTSGTSGTPLTIYIKRDVLREYYALLEARVRRWNNVKFGERWAILGGQRVIPFHQSKPPFWVYNAGLNQLYLSTYHLSPRNAKWYVAALQKYNPTHMFVYPSSAHVLASEILEKSLIPPKIKVIISSCEVLLESHRKTISRAFRCPLRNYYGMSEMVSAFSECDDGTMHTWPEVGLTEVVNEAEDIPAGRGEAGRLISTGLLNADMPLIRYEVGDRGSVGFSELTCACRKTLPIQASIEGRSNDLILTADGRRIFWLNPVFYGLAVREAQVIQQALDKIRVLYVPSSESSPDTGPLIIKRLRERLGNVTVILDQVHKVPRGANGKFRPIVSQLCHSNLDANGNHNS